MENKFRFNPENKIEQSSQDSKPIPEKPPEVEKSNIEKENNLAKRVKMLTGCWGKLKNQEQEMFYTEFQEQIGSAEIWKHFRNLGLKFENPGDEIDFSISDKPKIVRKNTLGVSASYSPQNREIRLPTFFEGDPRLDLILQAYFSGSILPTRRPFILNGKLSWETRPLMI